MSLLSSFGDYSFDSGLNLGLKTLKLSGLFQVAWSPTQGGRCCSFELAENIQYGVQYNDTDTTVAPGYVSVSKLDVPNKRIQFIQGPSRPYVSNFGRRIILNPFISNGNGWIINNPGLASTGVAIYHTTDGGATYSTPTGLPGVNIQSAVKSEYLSGSWFDGTTFAFINTSGSLLSTTDGTNWTSNGSGYGLRAHFSINNRSPYSGYWFAQESGPSYSYRSSVTGAKTTVSGYTLDAMSPNGRYLIRSNNSTYILERSTDGGASWSALSETMHYGTNQPQVCIDDNGNVFVLTYYNIFYNYNFTLNKWVTVGYLPSSGANYAIYPQIVKIGGVYCAAFAQNAVAGIWMTEAPPSSN